MWEHFHHQADIGVRGIGASLDEAFQEGAYALMAVMCSPDKVTPLEEVDVACDAPEHDLLFADWLNELIYEMEVRGMLFSKFQVNIQGDELSAKAWGETVDPEKHDLAVAVKAATFMELKVVHKDKKWTAQCVVDV